MNINETHPLKAKHLAFDTPPERVMFFECVPEVLNEYK